MILLLFGDHAGNPRELHPPVQAKITPASVLLLLPKDQSPDQDYGFRADWLKLAISNREEYARYHSMCGEIGDVNFIYADY